jgi:hypothetical protein
LETGGRQLKRRRWVAIHTMSGENNLQKLLAYMQPDLKESDYVFCTLTQAEYTKLSFEPICIFHEEEAITIIATKEQANASKLSYEMTWACITLRVHSSLSAIGFLAAITNKLASAGISVNAISAYYHDHLFVLWDQRYKAIEELENLSKSQ